MISIYHLINLFIKLQVVLRNQWKTLVLRPRAKSYTTCRKSRPLSKPSQLNHRPSDRNRQNSAKWTFGPLRPCDPLWPHSSYALGYYDYINCVTKEYITHVSLYVSDATYAPCWTRCVSHYLIHSRMILCLILDATGFILKRRGSLTVALKI